MKFTRLLALIFVLSTANSMANDVGKVQLTNSGSPSAQADFLHGLAQLHNFEFASAAESFRRAQLIDPDFALAYWGEALTYNHPLWAQQDTDAGRAVLSRLAGTKAAQLSIAENSIEKDFVHAAQLLYGDGNKHFRDYLYRDQMAMMYERYPGNPDVGAFYALSLMGTAHDGRDFTIYMKSAAITTKLFPEYPQHPGIAHYLIHATDDPIHAPLGYQAALAYSKIAPDAGHAQHMTSHIFLALGHWQASADANDNAVAVVDKQRVKVGRPTIGCGHYPSWQMYAYLQQGRVDEANARMARCFDRTVDSDGNNRSLSAFYYMKELYLFDTEDWTGDVASLKIDPRGDEHVEFSRLYIDATLALRTGSEDAMAKVAEAIKAGDNYIDSLGSEVADRDIHSADQTRVKTLQLKSWAAWSQSDTDGAEAHIRSAVAIENDLPFGFGPPSPAKPSLEALGDLLLAIDRYEEAAEVFTQALARTVNRSRAKHGLVLAKEGSKKSLKIANTNQTKAD
jgi:tetratricopeptide (TPR) repeat protein